MVATQINVAFPYEGRSAVWINDNVPGPPSPEVIAWLNVAAPGSTSGATYLTADEARQIRDELSRIVGDTGSSNDVAATVASDYQQAYEKTIAERDELQRRVRELESQRNSLHAFEQQVVDTVVNYRDGCPSGKKDFLEELGLEWPREEYIITLYVTADAGDVGSEDVSSLAYGFDGSDYDSAIVNDVQWSHA